MIYIKETHIEMEHNAEIEEEDKVTYQTKLIKPWRIEQNTMMTLIPSHLYLDLLELPL